MQGPEIRYGVRISRLDDEGRILIEQTWREHPGTGNNPYRLTHPKHPKRRFRHIHRDNDEEIAETVRQALQGAL